MPLCALISIVAVASAAALDVAIDDAESRRGPPGATTSMRDRFPQSAGVEYFPPRPSPRDDAEYLVWISGAPDPVAADVRRWAFAIADLGPAMISELFAPVRAQASEYLRAHGGSRDFAARGDALRSIMRTRDAAATELFDGERALFRSLLHGDERDPAELDTIEERVMLARMADAVADVDLASPHLGPNALRLLHAAAADERTGVDAAATVRSLAIDHAPRVLEQRRMATEALLRTGHRGYAALARAVAEERSTHGAMAGVFRPLALAAQRVAATNRELLAMARSELPQEVAESIERRFVAETYGPLVDDHFSYDEIAHRLIAMLDDSERSSALALIAEDTRVRSELRSALLAQIDNARHRFLEQGLVADPDATTRLGAALRRYRVEGERGAAETLSTLRTMASHHHEWEERDEAAFTAELGAWRAAVRRRVDAWEFAPVLSGLVAVSATESRPR